VSVDTLTSRIALPRLWRDLSGNLIVPFRYDAPLSNGLDIVRRSLGRHEIAMIQSTGIDKEYPACRPGLCRLASGGSFAVRQLYTDDEEVLFKAARPTLLNGIEDIIGRSDLADRAILLTLGPIGEEQRRSETELWREFELARPAILGALLDAAAHGLRAVGSVHLGRLPRMADFALWATACETGLWPANTFTRAYEANRKAAIEGIIDADPIAACVREFMSERPSWTGSAADLLRVSVERSSDRIPRDGTGWPKNPRALAGHLRRAQTFLRALGIEIAFSRQGRSGSRVIRMRSFPENTVSTVSSVSDSASGADSDRQP